jgi:hypothetical protein
VNESAVSDKVVLGLMGTRSAQSEAPVGAAAEQRPPELSRSGKRVRSHRWYLGLNQAIAHKHAMCVLLHLDVQPYF